MGLTAAVGLVSIITFLVLYLGAIREQEAALMRSADESRDYLVGALELPLWNYEMPTMEAVCRTALQNERVLGLVIKDVSGSVVLGVGRGRDPDGIDRVGKILHQGQVLGEVEVFLTRRYVKEAGQRLLWTYASIMLSVLVSLALLTHLLVRRFLRKPLETLNAVVRAYAEGSYDRPTGELPYVEFQAFGRILAQMGETIRLQMKEIGDAEAKYRSIFENATEGIFQSTPDGRFLSANPALARILGYVSPEELIASETDITGQRRCATSEDRASFQQVLEEHGFLEHFETEARRRDGSRIWVSINAHAVCDQDGQVLHYEGSVEDITERREAEEEVRRLNQELEQRVAARTTELQAANRELETMTYSVSHDLRQPLRHIDNFVGLLTKRMGVSLDDECRRYMATISEAAVRMARLIDDLLSFSRSGRFEMNRVAVDLGALAQEVVRELQPTALGRVVEWRVGELPVVSGDRAMLRVVFGNLISNALKFTQPREKAEIEIGCRSGGEGDVIVYVRDSGVGFDMQYAHKLFGVFERLHGMDEFKGTGIGLANVRRVIARHGGRTWAEGKVDGGATFYFSLPHA